ncbi:hypothetical protein GCM10018791_59870 [Streptomyces zaomyceticus]|nr:hypothetical protein GCM10018791_59870 [Streptomyces zaomyceticus]
MNGASTPIPGILKRVGADRGMAGPAAATALGVDRGDASGTADAAGAAAGAFPAAEAVVGPGDEAESGVNIPGPKEKRSTVSASVQNTAGMTHRAVRRGGCTPAESGRVFTVSAFRKPYGRSGREPGRGPDAGACR